jgi:hypothetical protein
MYVYAVWAAYAVFGTLAWLKWWPGISVYNAVANTVVGGLLLWMLGGGLGVGLASSGVEVGKEPNPMRVATATVACTLALFAFAAMIAGHD